MSAAKSKPWRWRKVKPPSFSRYRQPAMESYQWHRDHAGEIELVRDGVVYATVKPSGSWHGCLNGCDRLGNEQGTRYSGMAKTVEQAKADAKAAVKLGSKP